MSLSGRQAKLKIDGGGGFNELTISQEAALELTRELYETTSFGQDGTERGAAGVLDTSIDVTVFTEASQPTALTDVRDAILNDNSVDVEFSPDGNTSGGPSDVFKFTAKPSSYNPTDASVGSEQTTEFTLENSDGTKVTVDSSFT